jgi:hypothetical protein
MRRITTTSLTREQVAAFQAYVVKGRHQLGKYTYKPDVRIAREVFGKSTPELTALVGILMRKYFQWEARLIRKRRTYKAGRMTKPRRILRTTWTTDYDGWLDLVAKPEARKFIKYVRDGKHVIGLRVKSYATMARELGTSPSTVRRWMQYFFRSVAQRKERQEQVTSS